MRSTYFIVLLFVSQEYNIAVWIEVAQFMSNLCDVAETVEHKQKGRAPKGIVSANYDSGHRLKKSMTVIVRC